VTDWRSEIAGRLRGECRPDEPLSPRTSIRVGGRADLLARPADARDLVSLLATARALGQPVTVIGGGANLLVADAGVRGVVVRLPAELSEETVAGETVTLSGGAPIARLPARGHELGLVGAEFLAGVPGTLGGATVMNAGTRQGEMKDVLTRVELATADGLGWVEAGALGLAYRESHLPEGAVVTRVECRLRPGEVGESRAAMDADVARRRATQPLSQPTFGSAFSNPPGRYAGQLIQAVGLKGHRIGNAMWSDVHANFIVNLGGATARQVVALLELAQTRVRSEYGLELRTEVRLVGDFLAPDLPG
jgi:UDP-N-acetylmuramate dehydrogenase